MFIGNLAALICIVAFQAFLHSDAALVAVYSVQRHGARNVLPKGIFLTEDDLIGGPTLLPQGQLQTYNAGVSFRTRYLNTTTCVATSTCLPGFGNGTKYGVLNQPGVGFGNFNLYVRSSSLDRAILSGQCFFNGIFPPDPTDSTNTSYMPTGEQVVPVYTRIDAEDILIRAYTKCSTYQNRLLTWFSGPEFSAKVAESEPLRRQVQMQMPGMDTTLVNWWNVYDAINVYRTYNVGNPVPNFTQSLFNQIQDLAYWLETSKMRSNLTGNLLGGVALADLTNYFRLAATASSNGLQAFYRLLSLSGHYNTQLGLIAALDLDTWTPAQGFSWLRSLPKLAAVMVFELHAIDAAAVTLPEGSWPSFFVRLVYQDGPAASYGTVPLPCMSTAAAVALSPGACTLSDFLSYASARALNDSQAWCAACNNSVLNACVAAKYVGALAAAEAAAAPDGSSGGGGGTEPWKIAVSVVVTFVGTVLLAAVAAAFWFHGGRGRGDADAAAARQFGGGVGNLATQLVVCEDGRGRAI
ncbi:hypothetical protein Vafri_16819 [Volvox africanus]|uniref:Uncharacterized protein n=1 Tax=Volvox africanus TaxID=51714 RepID=A0A8J4BKR4_9CHLO|nr:hypothetical protein Vafri_16819 [Volvox africanus]